MEDLEENNKYLQGLILSFRSELKNRLLQFIQLDTMGIPNEEEVIKYTQEFDRQPILITLEEFDDYFGIKIEKNGTIK